MQENDKPLFFPNVQKGFKHKSAGFTFMLCKITIFIWKQSWKSGYRVGHLFCIDIPSSSFRGLYRWSHLKFKNSVSAPNKSNRAFSILWHWFWWAPHPLWQGGGQWGWCKGAYNPLPNILVFCPTILIIKKNSLRPAPLMSIFRLLTSSLNCGEWVTILTHSFEEVVVNRNVDIYHPGI